MLCTLIGAIILSINIQVGLNMYLCIKKNLSVNIKDVIKNIFPLLKQRKLESNKMMSGQTFSSLRHHQGHPITTPHELPTTTEQLVRSGKCDPDDVLKTKMFGHSSVYYPPILLCFIVENFSLLRTYIYMMTSGMHRRPFEGRHLLLTISLLYIPSI